MDLMKTLLMYMSATMMLSVQSTSAPKGTPAPTPGTGESAIVETVDTETPDPDDEVIDAALTAVPPEMLDKVTLQSPAPVPTITPNTRGYHNLTMGMKGKDVRKLQEKLIELRYLPEGSADGAYGRKTAAAVKKFQYYNGLKQDGIAGRATQTNLFENPDIVANPEVEPVETPAPETTEEEPAETTETTGEAEPAEATDEAPGAETAEETGKETAEAEPVKAAAEKGAEAQPGTEEETGAEEGAAEAVKPEGEQPEAPAEEKPEEEKPAEEAQEKAADEQPAEEKPAEEKPTEEKPEEEKPAEEKPAEETQDKAADEQPTEEVVENVDLDAEAYEPTDGAVALNESTGPLEYIATEDGVPVTATPRLERRGTKIRVSLDDLCKCVESWQLTDDGAGAVVLEAAGYTLALYNEESGCSATLDGTEIAMKAEDFDFTRDGHFISADFLAAALKGEAAWDQDESTLMLRIRDKDAAEATD